MRFTLPLIALFAIAAPVSAIAQTQPVEVPVRIAFADIDLSTAEGRAALEQRVEAKLRKACTIETNARYAYGQKVIDEKCLSDARAEAMNVIERVAANSARSGRQASAN